MQLKKSFAVSIVSLSVACSSAGAGTPAEVDNLDEGSSAQQKSPSVLSDNLEPERTHLPVWSPGPVRHHSKPDASADDDAGGGSTDAGHPVDPDAGHAVDAAQGRDASVPATVAGLHASGGQILNAASTPVRLHGVNHSGSEFACVGGYGFFDGPTDQASITAMQSWNINFVRVPLNEDCWLGINGVSATYSGSSYQAAIEAYVDLLVANGMYVSVDLHWNAPGTTLSTGQEPMADSDHAPAFWTSVATAFKGSGSVMFELYNEPWPDNDQDTTAAWTCWLHGGTCPSVSYPVAGMQTLVDTVRATGATNLLVLGGVEYSNALSQWATYKPTDPLNNLAAAWHVYAGNACSDTSCFDQIEAPLSTSIPIVATEVGDSSCDGTFPTTVMSWLDAHGQGYSGWTWNAWGTACGNYSVITDSDGTPNGAYGQAFKTHFLSL